MKEKIEQKLKDLEWLQENVKINYSNEIACCESRYKQLCSDMDDEKTILQLALQSTK